MFCTATLTECSKRIQFVQKTCMARLRLFHPQMYSQYGMDIGK